MPNNYSLICGMEVHVELKTKSKMFCGCKNDPFHAPAPNTYTCPVCLGMPGALPVPNKTAIEWTIKLGLALNCKINLFSKFDRKHYFYPDLPKGYQISQYDIPFCYDGWIETSQGKVRITRIHLEEDTGKLQHKTVDGEKVSLIDFNRSSVPLVEIVTEPDIHSAAQAKEYGKNLRDLIRYLDIADCDMEQGGMRLEANTSLQLSEVLNEDPTALPNYKVELKNINSFKFLEQAITYEMKRQATILDTGHTPAQETRGWNPNKGESFIQRSKESAEDYRYFPDPDIPPLRFTPEELEKIKAALPTLPQVYRQNWQETYGLRAEFIDQLVKTPEQAKAVDRLLVAAEQQDLSPQKVIAALVNKKITLDLEKPQEVILTFKKLESSSEIADNMLDTIIDGVIEQNPDAVANYRAGKKQVIGFLIGMVKKEAGNVDARPITEKLMQKLS